KRWRWALLILVAIVGGAIAIIYAQPLVSEEELAEAEDRFEDLVAEAERTTCSRPTLGNAPRLSQEEFQRLLHEELEPCFDTVQDWEALREPVRSDELGAWGWTVDRGESTNLMVPPGRTHFVVRHPPAPTGHIPEAVRDAEVACTNLEGFLAQVAATPDLCTPHDLTRSADSPLVSVGVRLARASSVVARKAWRDGDASRALEILEHALITARTLRSGACDFLYAMISVATENILISEYQSVLVGEIPFGDDVLETHIAALDTIADAAPSPADYFKYDAVSFVRDFDRSQPEGQLTVFVAAREYTPCEPSDNAHQCLAGLPAPVHIDPPSQRLVQLRLFRSRFVTWMVQETRGAFAPYVARVAMADRDLAVLPDLLRVAADRDRCPPDVSFRSIPGTSGATVLDHYSGDQYELVTPPLSRATSVNSQTVFNVICPPARAEWGPVEATPAGP
ncbi:MAG: hypothetical protein AAGE52_33005, partial [Myxococcota bacterium]